MNKLEIFYKRYVDDIDVKRKRNVEDQLTSTITMKTLNAPKKFLDTQMWLRMSFKNS